MLGRPVLLVRSPKYACIFRANKRDISKSLKLCLRIREPPNEFECSVQKRELRSSVYRVALNSGIGPRHQPIVRCDTLSFFRALHRVCFRAEA